MSNNSSDDNGSSVGVTRRDFLKAGGTGLASLLVTSGATASVLGLFPSCTGSFHVEMLNNALDYSRYNSHENISHITLAYLNAADLRGNTSNIWKFITRKKARRRAKWLAKYLRKEGVDLFCLSEVDYKGTLKTGGLDQPKVIAEYMGTPFNYVIFDEYMKSPLWTTGNAVISRFPLKAIKRHIYGNKYGIFGRLRHVYKDFIHVGVKVGKRHLDTIVNHFDDGEESVRVYEAEDLRHYVTKLHKENPKRFLVAPGDYNCGIKSKPMRHLTANGILHLPKNAGLKTYPADKPDEDIDHILAKKALKMTDFKTFEFPWSDHLGIMCELEFTY